MINRKFFDDICDTYVHDYDDVKYCYVLTDENDLPVECSDSPAYHDLASNLYVIHIPSTDKETYLHLVTDPSRCTVEKVQKDDPDCPIPVDEGMGICHGIAHYSYERHLHCTRIESMINLHHERESYLERGVDLVVDDKIYNLSCSDEHRDYILGAIQQMRSRGLDSYTLVTKPIKKPITNLDIEKCVITTNMIESLELAVSSLLCSSVNIYNDLIITHLETLNTIEDIEAVKWPSIETISVYQDIEKTKASIDQRMHLTL